MPSLINNICINHLCQSDYIAIKIHRSRHNNQVKFKSRGVKTHLVIKPKIDLFYQKFDRRSLQCSHKKLLFHKYLIKRTNNVHYPIQKYEIFVINFIRMIRMFKMCLYIN